MVFLVELMLLQAPMLAVSLLTDSDGASVASNETGSCVKNGYECPPYSVLEGLETYEIRSYPPTNWATTAQGGKAQKWQNKAFMTLFRYIGGENEAGQEIEMTIPVQTKFTEDAGVKKMEMGFYVPAEFQDSVPVPTNADVKIVKKPEMNAFVRTFQGQWVRDNDWKEHRLQLLKDLEGRADFKQIDTKTYYQQVFTHRHNEVFFV